MPVPETILFEMRRGGNHPDPTMNSVELSIAESAYNLINTNPNFSELSPRTVYNYLSLNTFYGSQNPGIIKLLQRLEPYPFMIEMEVVQWMCPLKCIQCEIQYDKIEKPEILSFERFKYVMDQFPDLRWAGNNALGDPFLNPKYHDMVKYIDDKEVPQEIYLTSHLLKKEDMKRFVDYKSFLFTKFSFDGATKETYEKIRPGVNFEHVVENIKALGEYKRQAGKHWPQIEFHFLLMKQNIHEAEVFLDFVDSLGVEVSAVMYSQLLHNYPEINHVYTTIPEGMGQRLIEKGKSLGIPVYFNSDASNNKPKSQTCTQYFMPYIFPSGDVIACCQQNEQNRRWWQRENSLGNVFEKPFREIWMDKPYVELRKKLRENYYPPLPICANCATHISPGKSL
jgi:MoaA/NifB/PqqE/SkfB family radical SAM enzyme